MFHCVWVDSVAVLYIIVRKTEEERSNKEKRKGKKEIIMKKILVDKKVTKGIKDIRQKR